MTEFERLKKTYFFAIQAGLSSGKDYNEMKNGNDFLHGFCEQLINIGNYFDEDKEYMKNELKILKDAIDIEITSYFKMYNN